MEVKLVVAKMDVSGQDVQAIDAFDLW